MDIVERIPRLSVRPMLLAHIPDLLDTSTDSELECSVDLYERMISAWIRRELAWFPSEELLRAACEELAVVMYAGRFLRGSEAVRADELVPIATAAGMPLEQWQLTGRSLLNKNEREEYRFSHRSIMEYLYALRVTQGDARCQRLELTDQMLLFISEMCGKQFRRHGRLDFDADKLDLRGFLPVIRQRAPQRLHRDELANLAHAIGVFDRVYNPRSAGNPQFIASVNCQGREILVDFARDLSWMFIPEAMASSVAAASLAVMQENSRWDSLGVEWRVPTLEQAWTLLVRRPNASGLYTLEGVGAAFRRILTSDVAPDDVPWTVSLAWGGCVTREARPTRLVLVARWRPSLLEASRHE